MYWTKGCCKLNKSMNNETRVKKIIRMINKDGQTWEDISREMELSVPYLQKLVRKHYATEKRYNNLLHKARENKKVKGETKSIQPVVEINTPKKLEEVILMETGYLIEYGLEAFLESIPIFIPQFCINELEKMSSDMQVAKDVLLFIYSSDVIKTTNLRGKEVDYWTNVPFLVKNRTKGIVSAANYLKEKYGNVRVITNSYEVEKTVNAQNNEGIKVILKKAKKAS